MQKVPYLTGYQSLALLSSYQSLIKNWQVVQGCSRLLGKKVWLNDAFLWRIINIEIICLNKGKRVKVIVPLIV